MDDIRLLTLTTLWVVVLAQSLFVIRYGLTRGWRYDFVGRALFFKSTAVLAKGVADLLVWIVVPELVAMIPTWVLVAIVFADIYLALGCTWQYTALERQKREDRHGGTELGREVDAAVQ